MNFYSIRKLKNKCLYNPFDALYIDQQRYETWHWMGTKRLITETFTQSNCAFYGKSNTNKFGGSQFTFFFSLIPLRLSKDTLSLSSVSMQGKLVELHPDGYDQFRLRLRVVDLS